MRREPEFQHKRDFEHGDRSTSYTIELNTASNLLELLSSKQVLLLC